MTDYKVEDVPTWVDKVYSAELLIDLYDYNGSLKHGFINSILPALRRYYKDDQEGYRQALMRHTTYFNLRTMCGYIQESHQLDRIIPM